jgi:cation:H+ antiporter
MIVLSVVVLLFALDGTFSRVEGLTLVAGLAAYICCLIYHNRRENAEVRQEYAREFGTDQRGRTPWLKNTLLMLPGLLCLCSARAGW